MMDEKEIGTKTKVEGGKIDPRRLEEKFRALLQEGGLVDRLLGLGESKVTSTDIESEEGDAEEDILLSEIRTPDDLAWGLVASASKKARLLSDEVSKHSYFFRDYLEQISLFGGLPTPYIISHSPRIEGSFSFKYEDERKTFSQLIKYIKGVFVERVRKEFNIPDDAEVEVNLFGTEKYDELKNRPAKYKNIVFPVYLAALVLEEESRHRVLAEDLLGIEIKHSSHGEEHEVILSNAKASLNSLPGFGLHISTSIKARPYNEHERTSYFFYPANNLSPRHQVLFNLFFFVSLFDYLFGYSRESKTFTPVYNRIDKDYLRSLYGESGRLDNDVLVVREIKVILEEISELEKSGEALEEGKVQSILASGRYPGLNSLSEFIKRIWKDYVAGIHSDKKRTDKGELGNKDPLYECVSSLLLLFALSEVESDILKNKDLLKELTGRSFSSITVVDLPYVFSRIAEKAMFQKFAEKPHRYISNQKRMLQNLAQARVPRETVRAVTSIFDAYVLDTVRYLGYSGVSGVMFKFGGRVGTAAAYRGKSRKGEDVYAIHFNPYFFVRTAIIHSIDLDILFSTILFHEFVHIRLRHLKREIKSFGHERYITEIPKELSSLIPEGIDNIHQDVYINYLSAKMAEYFSKAKYPYGGSSSMDQERRIKALLSKNFYYAELEDYNLPQIYAESTPSGTEVSGGIVSPKPEMGKNDPYNKLRFYQTKYKLAIPNIITFASSPEEAIKKYVYKAPESSVRGESLSLLFSKRDMVGLGSLLRIIAIIVHEVISNPHSSS